MVRLPAECLAAEPSESNAHSFEVSACWLANPQADTYDYLLYAFSQEQTIQIVHLVDKINKNAIPVKALK